MLWFIYSGMPLCLCVLAPTAILACKGICMITDVKMPNFLHAGAFIPNVFYIVHMTHVTESNILLSTLMG